MVWLTAKMKLILVPALIGVLAVACKTFKGADEESELRSARQIAAKVAEMHPPPEDPLPQVASYRYRREISMYYKLELAASKAQIANTLAVMRAHDHEIRSCYAERLEQVTGLSGDLQISFVLQKATGLAVNVSRTGGSLSDLATITCVTKKIGEMRFNAKGDYRGRVRYAFTSNDQSPDRAPPPAAALTDQRPIMQPIGTSKPSAIQASTAAKLVPQMQMPAKAKPAQVAPQSTVARQPTQQQKTDQKESANQKCSGCKGQDSGKQQAEAVSQKSKNTN